MMIDGFDMCWCGIGELYVGCLMARRLMQYRYACDIHSHSLIACRTRGNMRASMGKNIPIAINGTN